MEPETIPFKWGERIIDGWLLSNSTGTKWFRTTKELIAELTKELEALKKQK